MKELNLKKLVVQKNNLYYFRKDLFDYCLYNKKDYCQGILKKLN